MTSLALGIYLKIVSNNLLAMRYGYREYKLDRGEWPFDDTPIKGDNDLDAMRTLDGAVQIFAILLSTFTGFGFVNMYCFLALALSDEAPLPFLESIREQFRQDLFNGSQSQASTTMSDSSATTSTGIFPAVGRYSSMADLSGFYPAYTANYSDYDLTRDSDLNYTAGWETGQYTTGMESDRAVPSIESAKVVPSMESDGTVSGMASDRAVPGMASDRAVPGMASNRVVPGMVSDKVMPSRENNRAVPGMESDIAVPGMESNRAVPGMKSDKAVPSVDDMSDSL